MTVRLRLRLAALLLAGVAAPLFASTSAQAQLLITATNASTTTTAANTLNFGTNTPGANGLVSTAPIYVDLGGGVGTSITFTGNSGIYNGSAGPWAPDVIGGRLTNNFLAANGGTVTMTFVNPIANFGFLWGSVGPAGDGNTLTFYSGNTIIGTAKGADVLAAAGVSNNQSTIATLFSFPTQSLTKVVATTNSPFEFTLLKTTQPVPAPLSPIGATALGNLAALGGLAVYRRRRKRKVSRAICL